jgi:hypothetical protein
VSLDGTASLYLQTVLAFGEGPDAFCVDLRQAIDRRVRRRLHRIGLVDPFAVITACNPKGQVLSEPENRERSVALERELRRLGLPVFAVEGHSPDGAHREPGYAAPLDHWEAREIGCRFGQNAVFWHDGARMWLLGAIVDWPPTPLPADALATAAFDPVALSHRLYVIRLSREVLSIPSFRERNPGYVEGEPCVYVGSTGCAVEIRFMQHVLGYKANRFARDFGRELMYDVTDGRPLQRHADAVRDERALADRLRRRGWAVWQA